MFSAVWGIIEAEITVYILLAYLYTELVYIYQQLKLSGKSHLNIKNVKIRQHLFSIYCVHTAEKAAVLTLP